MSRNGRCACPWPTPRSRRAGRAGEGFWPAASAATVAAVEGVGFLFFLPVCAIVPYCQRIRREIVATAAGSSGKSIGKSLVRTVRSPVRRTIGSLRSQFDRVIIDAPPAAPLADVGIVTPLVDSVLLVVRAGITAKPAVHDALTAIDEGKLLGIVLNEAAA